MTKMQSVTQLRRHLAKLFDNRHQGTSNVLYAKTQGYVDGYIQAMGDAGILDNMDLLKIIAEERNLAASRAEKEFSMYAGTMTAETFA
jgi:hypothetical protein